MSTMQKYVHMIVAIIMNCCWGCLPKIHPWNWHMHISMAYVPRSQMDLISEL